MLHGDNRCYTSFQVQIKLLPLGMSECDSDALATLSKTFSGLPGIIKPTPHTLNWMCLSDARGEIDLP